mmetsp:Transcript_9201/g.10259  ORF Transcript_9201/g.10259 Transcript_9201/m.10259 type:complete len:85 (-) Transcript_9201:21-275(-)
MKVVENPRKMTPPRRVPVPLPANSPEKGAQSVSASSLPATSNDNRGDNSGSGTTATAAATTQGTTDSVVETVLLRTTRSRESCP